MVKIGHYEWSWCCALIKNWSSCLININMRKLNLQVKKIVERKQFVMGAQGYEKAVGGTKQSKIFDTHPENYEFLIQCKWTGKTVINSHCSRIQMSLSFIFRVKINDTIVPFKTRIQFLVYVRC
jgi:hypothetical protein